MLTESTPRTQRRRRTAGTTLPRLVGQDLEVQLASGETRTYVNLDMAASTPAMEPVADAVIEFLPWYSSVHRGAGFASQVSTRAYEAARAAVAAFVGARSTDTVIFVRNTTEAINLLSHCLVLRPGHSVLSTAWPGRSTRQCVSRLIASVVFLTKMTASDERAPAKAATAERAAS